MSSLVCPVCGGAFEIRDRSYKCPSGHSFDIAAKGYVNLLLSNHMNAKLPGDNKLMVNARAEFLGKGYYSHLAEAVSEAVLRHFGGGVILDAGCGEGYYTENIYRKVKAVCDDISLVGIDISKFACAYAARRFKGDPCCETAAASVFHIPMADGAADTLVTMFAPFCREEYHRVLKSGGSLIMAIPSEEHLLSFKEKIYDEPYLNKLSDTCIEGFELVETIRSSAEIFIDNAKDIGSLFAMTPYYYKTGEEGHRRVNAMETLTTQADFTILCYTRT